MNSNPTAEGAIPFISMLDYLSSEINRPDLFQQQAYQIEGGGGGSARTIMQTGGSTRTIMQAGGGSTQSMQRINAVGQQRFPNISIYYTIVSATVLL
jgi:hypothetical protein